MLTTLDDHVRRVTARSPWTLTIGLARSILAVATAVTLLANGPHDLYPRDPSLSGPTCTGAASLTLMCVAGPTWGRVLGVAVMAAVVSGWRPRWTAIPHWYVALSVAMTIAPLEGGDQIAAILTLLLLPNLLTDPRRSHWRHEWTVPTRQAVGYLAHSSIAAARFQVCVVYLHAAVGKLGEREWKDGTALWYWLGDPVFGATTWVTGIVEPVTRTAVGVAGMTWGTVVVELALAAGLVAGRRWRRVLLVAGVGLHGGIALLLGLVSFGITMIGALVLYLVRDEESVWLSGGKAVESVGRRKDVLVEHAAAGSGDGVTA